MKHLLIIALLCVAGATKIFAQANIWADEASKYYGKSKLVEGYFYHLEFRENAAHPDSAIELIYLSGPNHKAADFVNVVKIRIVKREGAKITTTYAVIDLEKVNKEKRDVLWRKRPDSAAKGKIVWFEGKPAIINKEEDIVVLEPID
ncbi:MAG TPA: hypothetical protein VL490_04580 [Mucilaginibacter sp.]|jgi:hypothetical protein|nr:hypothetical protein [Mucilaginibacter sp.]